MAFRWQNHAHLEGFVETTPLVTHDAESSIVTFILSQKKRPSTDEPSKGQYDRFDMELKRSNRLSLLWELAISLRTGTHVAAEATVISKDVSLGTETRRQYKFSINRLLQITPLAGGSLTGLKGEQ